MKHLFIKSTMLLLAISFFLTSCDKDKVDPNTQSASDNANAQSGFDDLARVTEDAISNGTINRVAAGAIPCANISITSLATDSTQYIINFPTGGSCSDGKVRSGTITAVLDGASYNTPGATLTITTTDYTVNGNKLEGKKVETCVSSTVHNIVVSDVAGTGYAKVTHVDGKTSTWKTARTRTLSAGAGDLNIGNNVYDISATTGVGNPVASGVNREGVAYTVDIISAIRVDLNCFSNNTARYPTQGVFKITPDGKDGLTVDYGSGACDNAIQVTYKDKVYDVTLNY